MGWSEGSYLAQDIWNKFAKYIPEKDKKKLATWLYDKFCDQDADDWDSENKLIQAIGIKYDE